MCVCAAFLILGQDFPSGKGVRVRVCACAMSCVFMCAAPYWPLSRISFPQGKGVCVCVVLPS